ncbi:MAG: class I SAM-dependent RNA methyltransferase [Dehalococcoidia bacterium]|nr:class I SAM-dependent RNA methyltransferase [Dehalococcoidia bacterium]MDW8120459.1 class I SAM-dependent RNA methyltransferase [Chloroflexota bacterium]
MLGTGTAPSRFAPGQRLRLTLGEMGALGECRAEVEGLPIWVFGGIPQEEVVAEVVRWRRTYAAARVVEVVCPSPHRVTPPCPYFWPCTGCQWQHIAYPYQLHLKRHLVRKALATVDALADVPVQETLPSPQIWGYRNHARMTIGPQGKVGFVNRTTREFVPIDACLLMHPWINQALAHLQGKCAETSQMSIRYGVHTGQWLIQPPLHEPSITLATGQKYYEEALWGRRFRIASPSFFQVNTLQAEQMVRVVRDALGLNGQGILVDAYAGVGTFGILLAPFVTRVIAIEESASAVDDARINAQGIPNIEFRQGKVEEVLPTLETHPDAVIVDPPRRGCHPEALHTLNRLAIPRLMYVSCDLEALVRDLTHLVKGPYRVVWVQPVDMFPHTHHIECLALLVRKDAVGSSPQGDRA